jgi:amino acid permease
VVLVLTTVLFVGVLTVGGASMQYGNLLHADWSRVPAALPLMVVGFSFHSVVPSLLSYLGSAKRVLQVGEGSSCLFPSHSCV